MAEQDSAHSAPSARPSQGPASPNELEPPNAAKSLAKTKGALYCRGILVALMLVLTIRLLAVDYLNAVGWAIQSDPSGITSSDCDSRNSPYFAPRFRKKYDVHPMAATNKAPDVLQIERLTGYGYAARAFVFLFFLAGLCSLGTTVVTAFAITFALVLVRIRPERFPAITALLESHIRFLFILTIPLFFGLFVNQGAIEWACLRPLGSIKWLVTQANFLTVTAIAFWLALTVREVRGFLLATKAARTRASFDRPHLKVEEKR